MAVKKRVFNYPHPNALPISVKIYAEFGGDDPENPTKLFSQKVLKTGRTIIPVYTLPWVRVIDLYNCGKLHPKSHNLVYKIITKQVTIKDDDNFAEEVGILDTNKPVQAGDASMVSTMDLAGAQAADGQSISGLKQSTTEEQDTDLFEDESV